MTPTLIALSRAYMALPGAPQWSNRLDFWRILDAARRYDDGTRWLRIEWTWTLDLTDAATGSVMLDLLAAGGQTVSTFDEPNTYWMMMGGRYEMFGATLAEAVARVAVALGRAG